MKVVVNRCYGGFGISAEALLDLVKSGSSVVKKMSYSEFFASGRKPKNKLLEDGYSKTDFNLVCKGKDLFDLNDDMDKFEIRSHPDLVSVVERLGKKADGDHADLEVIEVPDGIKCEIEEYDGKEWVSEKHRTW